MKTRVLVVLSVCFLAFIIYWFGVYDSGIPGKCQAFTDDAIQQAPPQYRENTDLWYKIYVACLKNGPEKAKSFKIQIQ